MDISPRDAFKLGFMTRCAEEQLTGDKLEQRIKAAAAGGSSLMPTLTGGTVAMTSVPTALKDIGAAWWAGLGLPFGASILGGAAIGNGLGRLAEPRVDDDDIRAQELAATYKLYADKAKIRNKVRGYRNRGGHL